MGANPLALLVAPLAGIALMTAAAAVAISPVLLTVSLTGKRRKRRDAAAATAAAESMDDGISPELEEKIHEIEVTGQSGMPAGRVGGGGCIEVTGHSGSRGGVRGHRTIRVAWGGGGYRGHRTIWVAGGIDVVGGGGGGGFNN